MNGATVRNMTGGSRDEGGVRTNTTITSLSACVIALGMTIGCGSPSSPNQEPTTPPVQERSEPPPVPETPAEAQPVQPAQQWPMPDLVGQVLQDAQDAIQAMTGGAVFFTGSHDLSGQDRSQVLDANWKVCTQNVAPGTAVTPESVIDVGVVKLDESCP